MYCKWQYIWEENLARLCSIFHSPFSFMIGNWVKSRWYEKIGISTTAQLHKSLTNIMKPVSQI